MRGSVPVYKLYVKCSELVFGQTLVFCPLNCLCYPNKNVIKNNIISSIIHIIVCLSKIE